MAAQIVIASQYISLGLIAKAINQSRLVANNRAMTQLSCVLAYRDAEALECAFTHLDGTVFLPRTTTAQMVVLVNRWSKGQVSEVVASKSR